MNEMNHYNGMNNAHEGAYTVPGYDSVMPTPIKKQGRGIETATLVFGILALLICFCNGFFGLVGFVLGIVAITKGKRSGMTITGLVFSVLGILASIVMVLFSMTEYGQELQDAFWEGFEEGYETSLGKSIDFGEDWLDEADEYVEKSVETHKGSRSISDKIAGRIVIDGENIQIPCKLSTILKLYELGEYSKDNAEDELAPAESRTLFLAKNGEECGICIDVKNHMGKKLSDINEGKVGMISIESKPKKDVEVFGGITLGMTAFQVEEVIADLTYNKSEMSGIIFYNIYANDNSPYSVSLMLSDGMVSNITLYYTN